MFFISDVNMELFFQTEKFNIDNSQFLFWIDISHVHSQSQKSYFKSSKVTRYAQWSEAIES